ncbi:helix-turn-helix domain-containing protein [Flavobacterium cerinum]|uniref:XRE family transcriptional regulator n=1 Tax=Flavobacterium cerinum TaxID=2502784 RepID=A0A3S3TYG2_9FLAO|nr:helix-turn-helix transcriptional regulator [Flavobacterium cerinum]RWW96733.1 XRE family transcriptional regulator [Flavobacterium cerinum]
MLHFKDKRLVKFGKHVHEFRLKLGLEPNDIAENSSITRRDLQAIEEGSKNFGFTTFLELAKGMGISPSDLLNVNLDD